LISRRFNRDEPGDDRDRLEGEFSLEKSHERRILSWSPDPDEELEPEVEEAFEPPAVEPAAAVPPPPQAAAPAPPIRQAPPQPVRVQPARVAPEPVRQPPPIQARPVEPQPAAPPPQAVVPAEAAPAAPEPPAAPAPPPPVRTGEEPRKRGRPRGRPRRQVHFHVDPDEELLLLEAAKRHGSQQKGLVAALQALQDNEVLRAEIERLRTENERQRLLLADAEALFNR
jgi:hypothetical protein